MLKKRLVFTLLYDGGSFMLSRNFRLQKVGDLRWLQRHYDFSRIAFHIDELIVLDVTRGVRDPVRFCDTLKALTEGCFVPIAAGGGVRSLEHARQLLRSGADKVVINTALHEQPDLAVELAEDFGQQCVVGAVDLRRDADGQPRAWVDRGMRALPGSALDAMAWLRKPHIGELYLNSMDRDGTGQGYDMGLLDLVAPHCSVPIILAGGVGNALHLLAGLADARVDAAATAHLFNFIGDGLARARQQIVAAGQTMASWPPASSLGAAA
ncbi:HisA/HisF-related TIM barrel protein [Acidovorax lacteus]